MSSAAKISEIRVKLDPSDLDGCRNGDPEAYAAGQRASLAAMYPDAAIAVEWNGVNQQRIDVYDEDGARLLGREEERALEDIEEALGAFWQGYLEAVDR